LITLEIRVLSHITISGRWGNFMRDISMHILDIVTNSLEADANYVEIIVEEKVEEDVLNLIINDNGKGMDSEFIKQVTSPFVTSRKTRKVGLGLSLLKAASERSGGSLSIESEQGKGTSVKASFRYGHIDRPPLGKIADTILGLVISNPSADFMYKHSYNQRDFVLDTREIRKVLKEVSLDSPEVMGWLKDYLREGLESLSASK
jgi:anti-sigma regulatory factor (Ser/Thr protein kinase)